ncbi:MAG: sugar-binding domain-containing protein, partial [Acidobacteriota bacterium]
MGIPSVSISVAAGARASTALVLLSLMAQPLASQELLQNVDGRRVTSLDGAWRTIVDPFENGYYNYRMQPHADGYFRDAKPADPAALQEYDFDTSPTLQVPGDWNSQRPELLLYEGTVWYRRLFDVRKEPGRRLFVHFGAANYEARVWLNGHSLGTHEGGFTPFGFEITDHVRAAGNSLVLKIDNKRRRDAVPTVNTDWWNYGGLTRGVRLVDLPATFIRDYALRVREDGTVEG